MGQTEVEFLLQTKPKKFLLFVLFILSLFSIFYLVLLFTFTLYDLQMRTIEATKTNRRVMIYKCCISILL